MMKCHSNHLETDFAFLNGTKIHVTDYDVGKTTGTLKCRNGHRMVFVNGKQMKKHFRHKYDYDIKKQSPMSCWHKRMQSLFDDTDTEVVFEKISETQISNRRADVYLKNSNTVIELQHSEIDSANVICRDNDYKCHNVNVIWIIDGNMDDVECEELNDGYLINFKNDWKYKSFAYTYDYILLNIGERMFKIPIKEVCMKMIIVKNFVSLDRVVSVLKNNANDVLNLWIDDNEKKARLTVQQKGAGNGKTYGIWKSIANNPDKETFFILSSQHTAKDVIMKELDDQAERNEYHLQNMKNRESANYRGRQYLCQYYHEKKNKKVNVIIGTVLSFLNALVENNDHHVSSDFFHSLIESGIHNGFNKVDTYTGRIRYAGESLYLNRTAELWIDESQDLSCDYYTIFMKLLIKTKIDIVIIGDKLQSLEHVDNFITMACASRSTKQVEIVNNPSVNLNHRIKVTNMAQEVNNLVHFEKYELPSIAIFDQSKLENIYDEKAIEIINTPDEEKLARELESYIKNIIKIVDLEVNSHDYKPNDFLFLFPIMKNNYIANELETKLNEYWIDKLNPDEFVEYVQIHKHEEGQVINTTESKDKTRIMSIKASKGDGRNVVFVLNCTEKNLKILSKYECNLIYESLFHVALTRSKKKTYFGLCKNNDDIHERFGKCEYVEFIPKISTNISLKTLKQYIDDTSLINLMKENGVKIIADDDSTVSNPTIDWEYHCLRHALYYNYALLYIIQNSNSYNSQIIAILKKISDLVVIIKSPAEFYRYLRLCYKDKTELEYFPLCNMSKKDVYQSYFNEIKKYMEKIIIDCGSAELCKSLLDYDPLRALFVKYMIDVYRNQSHHSTTPMTIYKILDFYKKDGSIYSEFINESATIKPLVKEVMKELYVSDIQWNIEHVIQYNSHDNLYFSMFSKFEFIGNNHDTIFILHLVTDYSKVSFWDIQIELLLKRFLLYDPNDKGTDIRKFLNKKIKVYIISLKQKRHYLVDWEWDSKPDNRRLISIEIKKAIVSHLMTYCKQLYTLISFVKEHKKDDLKAKKYTSPFIYISGLFEESKCIAFFFKELHNVCKKDVNEGRRIISSYESFADYYNDRMYYLCDDFLDLCDSDEDLWD